MNTVKLKAKILKSSVSIRELSRLMGIHKATLYRKTKGELDFTRLDILNICVALNLSNEELLEIFFDR